MKPERFNPGTWSRLGASLVSGILIALIAASSGIGFRLDAAAHDAFARAEARKPRVARPGEGSVALVYIDQQSLDWVEDNLGYPWPWPRELYGIMARFFSHAKSQGYDILFTEASSYGADDDARCASAMDEAGNVILALPAGAYPDSGFSPLPVRNAGWGSVRGLADQDGVLRRYLPLQRGRREGEAGLPSFGLAALGRSGNEGHEGSAAATFSPDAPVYLRFRGASPSLPAWNAAEILASAIHPGSSGLKPEDFYGSYVFVGLSAPGLLDRQAVPTDKAMPGAEIHATFVDNVLRSSLIRPIGPFAAWGIGVLFVIAGALIPALSTKAIPLSIAAFALAVAPFGLAWGLRALGFWASVGAGSTGGLFAFLAGLALSYAAEGKERAFLRRSFAHYLSPRVIEELIAQPSRLALGGEEKEISIFFSDIAGFTSISESMDPEQLGRFMNLYLTIATNCILAEGGTVDKYIGDAVVAFWNAPLDQEDHAMRAIRAALSFLRELERKADEFGAFGCGPPRTRIGIHTGRAAVGNFGSSVRFAYTALGDAVNTASRLEEANKEIGGNLLVSSSVAVACRPYLGWPADFSLRKLGFVLVDGKSNPIEVWEPISAAHEGATSPPSPILPWEGIRDCRIKSRAGPGPAPSS
ncbi:MAG TPA: adenylate/guanylate cyclase domain-containing protein [Rectinemataceae bacterium]